MFKKKNNDGEALEKLKQRIESQANVKENPDKLEPKIVKTKVKQPEVKIVAEPEVTQPVSKNKNDLAKELEFEKVRKQEERDNKIPGYGWLFGIEDKFLPESTILNRGEVLAFALGNMQENMLNQNRTESLFALFAKDIMRMNIAVEGTARKDALMARQQDADKGATMNNLRDLTGRPGAL